MSELVLTEDRGRVRHVILNRPEKRNAFNEELVLALRTALDEAADEPQIHVVVLRGNGPLFSSGVDLTGLQNLSPEAGITQLRRFRRPWLEAHNIAEAMAKPVVCQIHGAAIGGAMELALACDFRVMATDAVMGLPETRIGLIPDVGGTTRLPALVGLGRAKELILTSKMVGAEEAERIGLVQRIAPADQLEEAVDVLVGELLACSPIAVGRAKQVLDAVAKPTLAASLEMEVTAQEVCARSEDFLEGARAALEKRQPEFTGS